MGEGHRVTILSPQPDKGALGILTSYDVGMLIGCIGKLAVQRVRVLGARSSHTRDPTVLQKAPKGLQEDPRRIWLLKHGLHGEIAPVEGRRPDLLPLERKQHQLAHIARQPQTTDTTVKAERAGFQVAAAHFEQLPFTRLKHRGRKMDHMFCAH